MSISPLTIFTNQVLDYSNQLLCLFPEEPSFQKFNISVNFFDKPPPLP